MSGEVTRDGVPLVHPFELAGLGKAPFRYAGMVDQDLCYGERILNREEYERTGVRMTTKPGGSCDYCGQYIVRMYNVVSADGKQFHVGCECIRKTEDQKLVAAFESDRLKNERKKREVKRIACSEALKAALTDEGTRAKLAALPHVNTILAGKGLTLLDWAEFMVTHGGASGQAKALRAIKTLETL